MNAVEHFRTKRREDLQEMRDVQELLEHFTDDRMGNTALAQHLWGYKMWTLAAQLRRLVEFFASIGVEDQGSLRSWAKTAQFRRDFEGRIKGLGPAVFNWLIMRLGIETDKPDVHVRRFAEAAVGRAMTDDEVVEVITWAARSLGVRSYELDWAIWEHQKGFGDGPVPDRWRS